MIVNWIPVTERLPCKSGSYVVRRSPIAQYWASAFHLVPEDRSFSYFTVHNPLHADGSLGSGYFEADEVVEWLDGLDE